MMEKMEEDRWESVSRGEKEDQKSEKE